MHRDPVRGMTFLAAGLLIIISSFCNLASAQGSEQKHSSGKNIDNGDAVSRGRYIVEGLAVCAQCHTPRDNMGRLDRSKWLEGAALWLQPTKPSEDWPVQAPRIAGNPPGSDADMIKLLTTGVGRDHKPLRPPMPQFHMRVEDAEAVLAYLKSLNRQR
jgi:mono/diheme cytochrome c family protein